jgi:hypothetical protein
LPKLRELQKHVNAQNSHQENGRTIPMSTNTETLTAEHDSQPHRPSRVLPQERHCDLGLTDVDTTAGGDSE